MRNYFVALVLISMIFSACEKDDFCSLDTTPSMIVLFKDKDNQELRKPVSNLTVWAKGKDSIFVQQNLDSIAIPLDLNNNITIYNFANGSSTDEFTIEYNRIEEFVSRSCGYKILFSNLNLVNPKNHWIDSFEIQNTSIENEKAAHITFYH